MRILNSDRRYAEKHKAKVQNSQIWPNLEDLILSHACHIVLIQLCAMIDDGEVVTNVEDRSIRGMMNFSFRASRFLHLRDEELERD